MKKELLRNSEAREFIELRVHRSDAARHHTAATPAELGLWALGGHCVGGGGEALNAAEGGAVGRP